MKVEKRDGRVVEFETDKIIQAIEKAMGETVKGVDSELSKKVAKGVLRKYKGVNKINIEQIQDEVEISLMKVRPDVAKRYIIYREERNKVRDKQWEMNDLQADIYNKKYRYGDETFSQFLDRVSGGNMAIRKLIMNKKMLPAGRILAGRGLNERGRKVCYSNCFVLGSPEDNIESIFETAKKMARTYSYGGGVGFSLGKLRPNGAKVNNAAVETSGAVSFMDLYSTTTGLIGMKSRRGALMLSMPVTHPDIEEFITVKTDLEKVTKANISVMVTDKFMEAVKNGEEWEMSFKVDDTGEVVTRKAPAKKIFRSLAESNWGVAEPGILYWDRVVSWHINSENELFEYVSTNPCGEKPLPEDGSCLLASVNLSEYVKNSFTDFAEIDYKSLSQDIKDIVIYMNEVLDEGVPYLPLEGQKEAAKKYRQLGIGTMGLADLLIKMKVKYGSKEAQEITGEIMKILANSAIEQSALLAKEYGTYSAYNHDAVMGSPYLNKVATPENLELVKKYGLRNAELISIAPTGSISTLLGVSGGAEPIFQISYTRKSESLGGDEDVYYKVYTQIAKEYMDKYNVRDEENLPEYFITSMELDYRDRIDMQSEMQKYVDSAISSTVNLPEETTVEEIEELYMYAWEKGLKGITVYRDNCARSGILITDKGKEKTKIEELQEEILTIAGKSLEENPDECPMCGGKMNHSGGCTECEVCAYSPCSV